MDKNKTDKDKNTEKAPKDYQDLMRTRTMNFKFELPPFQWQGMNKRMIEHTNRSNILVSMLSYRQPGIKGLLGARIGMVQLTGNHYEINRFLTRVFDYIME